MSTYCLKIVIQLPCYYFLQTKSLVLRLCTLRTSGIYTEVFHTEIKKKKKMAGLSSSLGRKIIDGVVSI